MVGSRNPLSMECGSTKQLQIATTWSDTLTNNWGNPTNYTVRQLVTAASISTSGVKIRVTIEAATTEGLYLDNVAIVERDSAANGVTTPTEILFSGSSGIEIAVGTEEVSDWLDYVLDESKDYLLIADIGSDTSNDSARWAISGGDGMYYLINTNSYNTQNLAGPSLAPGYTGLFNKLEVMY